MPGSRLSSLIWLGLLLMLAGCTSDSLPKVDCLINDGACIKTFDKGSVALAISPRPVRAMKELSVSVTLKDMDYPEIIKLDLTMPGMNMGVNTFGLMHAGGGIFNAAVVIPRCPSGQRLWRAALLDVAGNELACFYLEVD